MKRLILTLTLAIFAAGAIGAPAVAWGPRTWNPDASFIGPCADPRLKAVFDNTDSKHPTIFKWVFQRGNKDIKPARKVVKKTVAPRSVKVTQWRWVRGGGSKTRISVWNPDIDKWVLLEKLFVYSGPAWGTGDCVKGVVVR